MSKSGKKSIENAAQIIEKFGGIRPMSSKINVAVTTIQGWKKRGTIPANRKSVLLRAAEQHEVDLSDFFEDAPKVSEVLPARDNADGVSVSDVSAEDAPDVAETVENAVDDGAQEETTEEGLVAVEQDDEIATDTDVDETASEESEDESAPQPENDHEDDQAQAEKVVSFSASPSAPSRDFTEIAVTTERRAITKSSLIAACMVGLVIVAVVATLWPDYEEFDARGVRLSELESEVSDIREKQSSFKGLMPENWSEQLEELKRQMAGAHETAGETMRVVKDLSGDLVGNQDIEKRVVQLQSYVSEISSANGISALVGRFDGMRTSLNGQEILDYSSGALQGLFVGEESAADSANVNETLDQARKDDPVLARTFSNVPKDELKAAAMLFALTQVRSSFNRGDDSFEGDLQLLKNMVGNDDQELSHAIDKLAPHSRSGLLSANGLRQELQSVTGEVVAASLSGEDVSFSDKMSAKMNDILKVEKSGEMVSGSEAQKTMDKADKLVAGNRIEDAVKLLKSRLNAKELDPIRPWIKHAEGVVAARTFQQAIERAIQFNTGAGYLGGEQLLNENFE